MVKGTDQNFRQEVLEDAGVVLVDFWAEWCMPCRMLGPIIDRIAQAYTGRVKVVKVNVDENPLLSPHYDIMAIPTVKIFKAGQELQTIPGLLPEAALRRLLDQALA